MDSMSSPPLICDLPSIVPADNWSWKPIVCQGHLTDGFWLGTDEHGQRWLAKVRGREYGLRELAFARLAQRLGWSCQSSIFVTLPEHCPIRTTNKGADRIQLVHWYYEEADTSSALVRAVLDPIDEALNSRTTHPLDVIKSAPIASFIDWPRSDVAAALFGAGEVCGRLLTAAMSHVIIDSEQMFASKPDSTLSTCWLQADLTTGGRKGLDLTLEVCESIARLSSSEFSAFVKAPPYITLRLQQPIMPVLLDAKRVARGVLKRGHL